MIMWVKDVSRAIDYVETRSELDHSKVAYYGLSWGSVSGWNCSGRGTTNQGMRFRRRWTRLSCNRFPKSMPLTLLSRVKQPVLMLNGRYDFFFPVESTQEPFYHLLGSKKDQKKHICSTKPLTMFHAMN